MRLPRIDFAGARHHVMNRGARHADVFVDDECRALFLDILSELPTRFGVRIHGYALMPNHYHLLVESVTGRLPRAMRHLGGEFTRRLNLTHKWDGPLFRGRYHNRLVNTDAYWRDLLIYVHLNPARSGFTPITSSDWTSHLAYTGAATRPDWLHTAELQSLYGSVGQYEAEYARTLTGGAPASPDFDPTRLWAPHSTGVVAVPDLHSPLWEVADALEAVARVTGLTVHEVIAVRMGRTGNPANWVAAWWMSRHCGIAHGAICSALGASHAVVSRRIATVEARLGVDRTLSKWARQLRRERANARGRGRKVESVKT